MKQLSKNNILRPLTRAFFLFIAMILCGCGLIKIEEDTSVVENSSIRSEMTRDYRDQLASLNKSLLQSKKIRLIRISRKSREYLEETYNRIVANNELLLNGSEKESPTFYIIDLSIPFIFSLPKSQFFISKGLIKKYFKNESLLIAALCFEIVKSRRNIYYKKIIIPDGVMDVQRLISLTRVSLEDKINIYKWSYFALRRAEYDASALLNWIQIQNKNTLDFGWMIGDSRVVTREEYEFKSFLAGKGVTNTDIPTVNSTKQFYRLKDSL